MKPRAREDHRGPAPDELVQLAVDLRDCMAFQPKKWRRVLENSRHLLDSQPRFPLNPQPHASTKRVQRSNTDRKIKGDYGRLIQRHPSRVEEEEHEENPDQFVCLPLIPEGNRRHPIAPSLSRYLHQPQLVDEILREAFASQDQAEEATEQSHKFNTNHQDSQPPGDDESTVSAQVQVQHAHPQPIELPLQQPTVSRILSTVSPRTRDELARLPPLSVDDTKAIHEFERMADREANREAMYVALRRFGQDRVTPSRFSRPRKLAATDPMEIAAARITNAKQKLFKSPWKKRRAVVVNALNDAQRQRIELIHMALEDVNVLHIQPASTQVSKPRTPPRVLPLPETVPAEIRRRLANDHAQLVTLQHEVSAQERVAEERVDQTLSEIQVLLPLEVIYAFGKGKFASPAQQRAASLLYRVGQRLKNNLLLQAVIQWKLVVAQLREEDSRRSALTLQWWWRRVLAIREVARRRRLRQELERRQQLILRQLATKQTQSALIITRSIRRYSERRKHQRLARRERAAITLQRFWREQQQAWLALRHQMRQRRRHKAAIEIQRLVRGWFARRRQILLQKIKSVEQELTRRRAAQASRAMQRHRIGAVLTLQRAVRTWIVRRVMALRRRRAQFERDKAKVLKIQAQYRGQKARRFAKRHREQVLASVEVVQRAWRCFLARRAMAERRKARRMQREKWREEVLARRQTRGNGLLAAARAVKPAASGPAWLRGKKDGAATTPGPSAIETAAATRMQAVWCGRRLRFRLKREHARAEEMTRRAVNRRRRLAAVAIQRRVRGMQGRTKAWNFMVQRCARLIQSAWRGFKTRRELKRMRAALLAIMKMQLRWRSRRREDHARIRNRASRRIQGGWRRWLGRRWLYRSVRRQQWLSEQHAAGAALLLLTRKRVSDELLMQSFVHRDVQLKRTEDEAAELFSVQRSMYMLNKSTNVWTRRGYDGLWQQVFRDASVQSLEIDNSHFARWLKAVPKGFVHARHLPTQTVDLVFAKMKEPKARTIPFSRFNKAMAMLWRERFKEPQTDNSEATDRRLFLRFMHDFVLHGDKTRALLELSITQRIAWAVRVLRRFAMRVTGHQRHAVFITLYRQQQQESKQSRAATSLQRQFRRYKFRAILQATLAAMFTEFIDYKSRCVRFEHAETKRMLVCKAPGKRPAFLRSVARCDRVVPLPFPGEEFHAFCQRHESATTTNIRVPATVYCLECEAPMCDACFSRDHDKRTALQSHTRKKLHVCSHCKSETATRECLLCGDGAVPFCDACFPFLHSEEPTKQHVYRRLVVACGECDERAAQWHCQQCDDVFCKRCLSKTHAKGHRQNHACKRLSYLSVLQQTAQSKRRREAQKTHDIKKKERDARRAEEERVRKLREASATTIQACVRSFQARQRGKAYMKLVRQTHAAKAQRLKDDRIRASIGYKLKSVVGLAPTLKSDTQDEIERHRQRVETIKRTLFLYKPPREADDDASSPSVRKKKKRWSKRSRAAVETAAQSWLYYDAHVKVTGPKTSEYKDCLGTILSTQSLFTTGHVLVFVPEAHKAVVVEWTHVEAHDGDNRLRVAYMPPSHAAINRAVDLRAKLTRIVAEAKRRAKLMYAQSIEFHDIVHLAWIVSYNKHAQKEEYWNVVLDKRTLDVPKAMIQIERMEQDDREKLDARVALAKAKLEALLHPYQQRDKPHLALRRGAVVPLPVVLRNSDREVHRRLKTEAEAMGSARFWHETIEPAVGRTSAHRFLSACWSTTDCWRLVKLLQWLDLQDDAAFKAQMTAFFAKTGESQAYIVGELAGDVDAGEMKDARANLDRLLKIKEETMQLLISRAEQAAQERDEQDRKQIDAP